MSSQAQDPRREAGDIEMEHHLDSQDSEVFFPGRAASNEGTRTVLPSRRRRLVLATMGVWAFIVLVILGVIASRSGKAGTPTSIQVETMNVETLVTSDSDSDLPHLSEMEKLQLVYRLINELFAGNIHYSSNLFKIFWDPNAPLEIYMEITREKLNKLFLVTALFEHGDGVNVLLHMPADDTNYDVFYFELAPDMRSVDLKRPQLDIRAIDDPQLEKAAELGAWTGFLKNFPLVGVKLAKDNTFDAVIIDVSNWFVIDGFYVIDTSHIAGSSTHASENDILPRISSLHAYDSNTEVIIDYHFVAPRTPGVTVSTHFSMVVLPDDPMKGRAADDRVGFFNTAFTDLGFDPSVSPPSMQQDTHAKESEHVDKTIQLCNRWRLEPYDFSAQCTPSSPCTPKKPIVYHIDPTVPEKWRGYLKAGVEEWNKAFLQAGFRNAIKAVTPGDPEWPVDYSAGDIRYSSITWAVGTGSTFALGPSVVDPRSGEIINADIAFTHGWVASYLRSFEQLAPATVQKVQRTTPHNPTPRLGLQILRRTGGPAHVHQATEQKHEPRSSASSKDEAHRKATVWRQLRQLLQSERKHEAHSWTQRAPRRSEAAHSPLFHHRHCQHDRMQHDIMAWLLSVHSLASKQAELPNNAHQKPAFSLEADAGKAAATQVGGPLLPDHIIGAGLKDVTMHEVGHTLGLRHNFKASTAIPFDQLRNRTHVELYGLTSSVMDYLPVALLSADCCDGATSEPHYFTPTLGLYDEWAIEYGYTWIADEKLGIQHEKLKTIAARADDQHLVFATDEDVPRAAGEDPHTSLFDLGRNPLDFYEDRLKLVAKLRDGLLARAVQSDEPWTRYYAAHAILLRELLTSGVYAAKFVGGNYINKAHRGNIMCGTGDQRQACAPVRSVPLSEARRSLAIITSLLANLTYFDSRDLLPYIVHRQGWCDGIERDCLGVATVDVLAEIHVVRSAILKNVLELNRLGRVKVNSWAYGHDESLSLPELMSTLTVSLWGPPTGTPDTDRLADTSNWPMQSLWIDALAKLASPPSPTVVIVDSDADDTSDSDDAASMKDEVAVYAAAELAKIQQLVLYFLEQVPSSSPARPQLLAMRGKISMLGFLKE